MFREKLITVANGFSHINPFNFSVNIQKSVGTIANVHFITANAVLLVKTQGILGFMAVCTQTH